LFYVSLGIALGLIMFLGIVFYLQANPLTFYETIEVIPEVDIPSLIQSILTMMGMSVVAGFIPAWFVTRQDILKAIWGR